MLSTTAEAAADAAAPCSSNSDNQQPLAAVEGKREGDDQVPAGPKGPIATAHFLPPSHPLNRGKKGSALPGAGLRSPTDNIMSPATQKVEAKRKHLLTKIKPVSLTARFQEVQREQEPRS